MSRKNKITQPLELQVHRLSTEGRGIAEYEGKKAFVFGALPDETVRATVTKQHSRYLETQVDEVLVPSAKRVTPICPHFGRCGGCQLQHLSSEDQLAHKESQLKNLLEHHGILPNPIAAPLTGPQTGYRYKARLGVRYVPKKGGILIGFRENHSNKIVEMESCSVIHPKVGHLIEPLKQLLMSLIAYEDIPQIEMAAGENEVALIFRHLKPLSEEDEAKLVAFCTEHELSLFCQSGGPETVTKRWPDTPPYLYYTIPDFDIKLFFNPLDFTQVNPMINRKMITQACDWLALNAQDHLLDLFCGLGNFSLPLARRVQSVIGVEGDAKMVHHAQENARWNGVENATFYQTNLFEDCAKAPWHSKSFNKIILDPPRSGAWEVVNQIDRWMPERILYISCNMTTFVRDAAHLVHQKGLTLQIVGLMDMFPHTKHSEVMGLFIKGN